MTSDQPVICDWQTSRETVTERVLYLFKSAAWSDCRFIVGTEPQQQQIFEGHKLIFAMSSPVFGAMLYGELAEKKDPIAILDVQPDTFKILLEYIYTDKITWTSFDQACELFYCGKKYMLLHLVEVCTKYLQLPLHPKNACKAYELAKLFEEPILMENSINVIRNQTKEVLSESNFVDVELSTIGIIFEQDCLNIQSELELFTAITRYASHQSLEKDSLNEFSASSIAIRDVLMKIRFLTLTPQEFAEGPASSDLLTEPEKFAILMNISSSSINVNMPQGFSTARIRRINHRFVQERKKTVSLGKLYEMDDNPDRRAWLDKLLAYMEERHTPILACPTISKNPLDLFRLYVFVKERGGFLEVSKNKTWKDIAGLLGIGASSSAAYTLRKHYTKNLLAYECQFDRGGIDPQPIINQIEASSKKKGAKSASVPSPGSSNSQDSFPAPGSGGASMDGYGGYGDAGKLRQRSISV